MEKLDIHRILDLKIKSASSGDRSRINRILVLLKADCDVLRNNYSQHLYNLYLNFYKKKLNAERKNYDDQTLITYVINNCYARLRNIKKMKNGH